MARALSDFVIEVRWSPEDEEWVATTSEYPSLSYLAPRPEEAVQGLVTVLLDIIKDH